MQRRKIRYICIAFNQRFIMQKETIYWGKCFATVGPPIDDYELWFFSDGKVLRENKAFAHMRELKEQGVTLIEVRLTRYPSDSRSEENPLPEEEAKNLSRVNYD